MPERSKFMGKLWKRDVTLNPPPYVAYFNSPTLPLLDVFEVVIETFGVIFTSMGIVPKPLLRYPCIFHRIL